MIAMGDIHIILYYILNFMSCVIFALHNLAKNRGNKQEIKVAAYSGTLRLFVARYVMEDGTYTDLGTPLLIHGDQTP